MNYYESQIEQVIADLKKSHLMGDGDEVATIVVKSDNAQTKTLNITLDKLIALQAIMNIGETD